MMVLSPGQQLGAYRLIRKLGSGGFGTVWLAERTTAITTLRVALKLPFQPDIDQLRQEAETWVRASGHPNIVPVFDADIDSNGQAYIVSEYVDGGTLTEWLRTQGGKAPSLSSAIQIMSAILKGLEHLHQLPRPLIHRDLKPDNILMQGGIPRLVDFGISSALRSISHTQSLEGTPPYMAPELFVGQYTVSSDLWAAGVTFYQLCTGTLPFPQKDLMTLLATIIMGKPRPLPSGAHPGLAKVFDTIFQKDPKRRYSSAKQMRAAIEALLDQTPKVADTPPIDDIASLVSPSILSALDSQAIQNIIEIPEGEFLMGERNHEFNPPHSVSLNAYSISRYPVTVREYFEFVHATGYQKPSMPPWGWIDDHPIVNVSWEDAMAYCAWLSKKTNRLVTLPTEAEWEKAARGTDGRRYPWGNVWGPERCANSIAPSRLDRTLPVGSFPAGASPYGLLDVAGNVWEWCLDWYDENYMRVSPTHNPTGPLQGERRVLRGGSWFSVNQFGFRVADRSRNFPDTRYFYFGFRYVVA